MIPLLAESTASRPRDACACTKRATAAPAGRRAATGCRAARLPDDPARSVRAHGRGRLARALLRRHVGRRVRLGRRGRSWFKAPPTAAGVLTDALRAWRPAPSSPETWDAFFSDFYLRAYANDERDEAAEAQALAAARLAACPEGGELLDVPCGSAATSLPLARAGYRATGVDRSKALLEEARRRTGHQRWPKLVAADYRELPFADASFDAAINLFSSLGYLGDEEDTRVLGEIRRVLRPGARLVLELLHRDRLVRGFAEQDWRLLGEGRLLLEQRTFDGAAGVAQTTQTLIDGAGQRDSRTFSVRVYSATELIAMLGRAGFEGRPRLRRPRRVSIRDGDPPRRLSAGSARDLEGLHHLRLRAAARADARPSPAPR